MLRKQAIIEPGIREFANAHDGKGAVITYGFMTHVPAERRTDTISDPRQGFERYSAEERAVIRQSLAAWSAVADITFVPVAAQDADVMFGQHRMPYRVNGYAGGLTHDLATGQDRRRRHLARQRGFCHDAVRARDRDARDRPQPRARPRLTWAGTA